MLNPKLEELLEDLFAAQEDATARTVQEPDAGTLQEALAGGWVRLESGRPVLTETGAATGRDVVRRHRLAECLLHDVLQIRASDMHSDACQLEHVIRPGLEERICSLLGHPTRCPDGRPIPRGACCERAAREQSSEVAPLCDGRAGQAGVVAYLSTRDNREIQKLMAMGILPGSEVRLIRLFPSYIFAIGHSQFTVDRSLAEKIIVHGRA
jgi:DtxR family Mn-dependent transcriptional regulator